MIHPELPPLPDLSEQTEFVALNPAPIKTWQKRPWQIFIVSVLGVLIIASVALGQARRRRGGGGRGPAAAQNAQNTQSDMAKTQSGKEGEQKEKQIRLVRATIGKFVRQVKLIGEIKALKQQYLAPAFSSKLQYLAEDGAQVKAGEVIARLDVKDLEEELDEQQMELQLAKNAVLENDRGAAATQIRLQAEVQRARAVLEQKQLAWRLLVQGTPVEELRKLELSQKLASSALQLAKSNLTLKEKLKAKGISTQLEVLQAQLNLTEQEKNLNIASAELQQARMGATAFTRQLAQLELQKAQKQLNWALQNQNLTQTQNTYRRQKLLAKQASVQTRVNQQGQQMAQSIIKAPLAGTVVLSKTWSNEGYKRPVIGDDVQQGNPFVSISDLGQVMISAELDETLLRQVKLNMHCTVEIPSLKGQKFAAKINHIGILAHQQREKKNTAGLSKVLDLTLLPIDQDNRFQPGTSVDIQLPLAQQDQVMLVPRSAVFRQGQEFFVQLADASERQVEIGDYNEEDVIVLKGLNESDEIYLRPQMARLKEAGPRK